MNITRYLSPKNDYAFKRLFGEERNKDILLGMLNSVLIDQVHKPIVDVEFLKTIQEPETAAAKQSIVDVLCKDQDGCRYVIEMQIASQDGFQKRAQYYAARAYTSQMNRGGDYEDLQKVIFLAFADYRIFDEKEDYKSTHVILDTNTYAHDLKDFSFTFVNLPKFMEKYVEGFPSSLEEKFYYFLAKAEDLSAEEAQALEAHTVVMNRALHELSAINWTAEEYNTYEAAEKKQRDYLSSLKSAKKEGKEEGRKEGEKIGRQKALQEMVDKGIITQAQADAMLK